MIELIRIRWVASAALVAGLVAGMALTGCGTPAAPQPPSLNLPDKVTNLAATRAGDAVSLTFTMPRKNTDKLLLKGKIDVRLCREVGTGVCVSAGEIELTPGEEGVLADTLPAELSAGAARPLSYFVELRNHNGRSAGLSNAAIVLAGQAPAPVAGFTAEIRKNGAVLRWTPEGSSTETAVRLHRRLLNPPAAKGTAESTETAEGGEKQQGILAPPPEPVELSLLVEPNASGNPANAGRALDKSVRFGESYEYTAQRVARVSIDGQTLELPGAFTAPVRIEAKDIFPPETPTGLAAVATEASAGLEAAIDLSWQPVTDANLAGYIVYRREGDGAWQRVSPAQPAVAPAFHDAQVQPGHSYLYAVSAIGQNGHESARSAEAAESMPTP